MKLVYTLTNGRTIDTVLRACCLDIAYLLVEKFQSLDITARKLNLKL